MSSYDDKLTKIKALIEDFNSQLPPTKVDFDKIQTELKSIGAFNDATLSVVSEADFVEAGLPKLLARQAVTIVSIKDVPEGGATKPYISEKKAVTLTVQQLVEAFDPRDNDNAVAKRLADISKNQPCVVYSDETSATIAIAQTVVNVNNIRDGYPARDFVNYMGVPTKCFRINERPFDMADENPLFAGQPLLPPEQVCTVTNRSWAKAPIRLRQLFRIATQTGEFRNTTENAHDLLDMIDEADLTTLFEKWSVRHPRAAMKFKEMEKQGTLPTLKIQRGGSVPTSQDPFFTPAHMREGYSTINKRH